MTLELVKSTETIADMVHRLRIAKAKYDALKAQSGEIYQRRTMAELEVMEIQKQIFAMLDEEVP